MKKIHLLSSVLLLALALPAVAGENRDPAQATRAIQKKIQSLQAQMQRFSEIPKLMEEFEPLMMQQKLTEAEAVVDRALLLLKELKSLPAE